MAPGVPAAGVPLRPPGCEFLDTLQRPRLCVQVGTSSIGQCDKAGAGNVSLRMNSQMLDAASRSKRDCRGKEWRHRIRAGLMVPVLAMRRPRIRAQGIASFLGAALLSVDHGFLKVWPF